MKCYKKNNKCCCVTRTTMERNIMEAGKIGFPPIGAKKVSNLWNKQRLLRDMENSLRDKKHTTSTRKEKRAKKVKEALDLLKLTEIHEKAIESVNSGKVRVKFTHERVLRLSSHGVFVSGHGGSTAAALSVIDDNGVMVIIYGESKCHGKDPFNGVVGKAIALARAYENYLLREVYIQIDKDKMEFKTRPVDKLSSIGSMVVNKDNVDEVVQILQMDSERKVLEAFAKRLFNTDGEALDIIVNGLAKSEAKELLGELILRSTK